MKDSTRYKVVLITIGIFIGIYMELKAKDNHNLLYPAAIVFGIAIFFLITEALYYLLNDHVNILARIIVAFVILIMSRCLLDVGFHGGQSRNNMKDKITSTSPITYGIIKEINSKNKRRSSGTYYEHEYEYIIIGNKYRGDFNTSNMLFKVEDSILIQYLEEYPDVHNILNLTKE